ncbi:MAG TPA: acyltransferase [Desulfobacteraceae bacterium]|nr:acyltransferase [Desulfobacteraceae bacterium]
MKKTHDAVTGRGSALSRYQETMVGSHSFLSLLYFEWCMLLGCFPGAFGIALRKIFWPRMFGSCGRGAVFAGGIVVRHPNRIRIDDNVVISENCVLDGRSSESDATIHIGRNVIMSNQVMLSCKDGSITIGENTGINAQTIIQSTNGCPVVIGRDCILGQGCLVIGGGSYNFDRLDIPIRKQGIRNDGGVEIREDVWLGGKVTVLGGVVLGRGAVVAAGAVVTRSIPEYGICAGVPAKIMKNRRDRNGYG